VKFYIEHKDNKWIRPVLIIALTLLYFFELYYEKKFPKHFFPWDNNKLPWHIEYIPNALFFMFGGYLFKDRYEKKFDQIDSFLFLFLITVLYLYLIYGNAWLYFNKRTEYRNIFAMICQIVSIIFLVSLSKKIRPNRYILYIGQNSLIYFGIAHYLNVPIQLILKTVVPSFYTTVLSNEYYSAIFSIIFAVISSLILIIPAYIINTYFPFLIGRKKVSKQS
jgi:hypothetical protein